MLGVAYEVIEEFRTDDDLQLVGLLCPDGVMRYFPPKTQVVYEETPTPDPDLASPPAHALAPVAVPAPAPVPETAAESVEQMPGPRPAANGASPRGHELPALTVECWALADETDIAQIERVVRHFVGLLEAEGALLPDNIHFIAPCREAAHQRCFVYRFGTRRLHFAARPTDDGRLTLVVRCGGGFMDFMDFVRRNGAVERMRLLRQIGAHSTGRLSMTSVRAAGRVQVRPAVANSTICNAGARQA